MDAHKYQRPLAPAEKDLYEAQTNMSSIAKDAALKLATVHSFQKKMESKPTAGQESDNEILSAHGKASAELRTALEITLPSAQVALTKAEEAHRKHLAWIQDYQDIADRYKAARQAELDKETKPQKGPSKTKRQLRIEAKMRRIMAREAKAEGTKGGNARKGRDAKDKCAAWV
jgi:hypothetical protein